MMAGEQSRAQVAGQVEHAVRRLEGLSILPGAASRFLRGVFDMQLEPRELAELVESEPALAVMMFSLVKKQSNETISIHRLCEQIPLRDIRDRFFSLGIYQSFDGDPERIERRRQLVTNAAAVAYCAREIAEQSNLNVDGDAAYTAGLLHSIGNLALDEAMPRSFAAIAEQAQSERVCISDVQERNIGLDYTVLGKRLAAKWSLPQQIQMAVWLHLVRPGVIADVVPREVGGLIQAVHLGYILARKFEIGFSGSYDSIELPPDEQLPGINTADMEDIARVGKQRIESRGQAGERQKQLADYVKAVQAAAAQLATEGTKAAAEARRAQTKASHFDFATEFFTNINGDCEPIELAQRFVCQWRKFYQTGAACLYLTPTETEAIEAVIVGGDNKSKSLTIRGSGPVIPQQIQKDFAVIDAAGVCDWLFEQLDVQFDTEQTKIAPLLCQGKAIGAIVFEFHYPVATSTVREMFEQTCFVGAAVLDAAIGRSRQQHLAERFARLAMKEKGPGFVPIKTIGTTPRQAEGGGDYISVLAEMAAGAAHELNNPLSIISGRAQLLASDETDANKAEALRQIQDNCKELSRVVEDLMSFAEPASPRRALVAVRQVIDEAVDLAAMKTQSEYIETEIELADSVNDVFVDSGQIVSSLANIITNAVESYEDKSGPVEIKASRTPDQSGSVRIEITDRGCGMNAETMAKAVYPFFSSKPAGRRRGMGLAYASRFIELNVGTLKITSEVDQGTTVTIILPCS
jgi:signal transduction histidine kinase/HD-like signal output (HDOD) protein